MVKTGQISNPVSNAIPTDRSAEQESITMSKNQILYGPPGTGKTYATIDKAMTILGPPETENAENDAVPEDRTALKGRYDELVKNERIRFVTFHQSFSYEDFVEGLRASTDEETGALRYAVEDGVFKQLCNAARDSSHKDSAQNSAQESAPDSAPDSDESRDPNYVLIIDEINRGNVSRIFGELITLIEPSKREGSSDALEVVLPYSKERFSVPDNLYIIGTMNTADRSLLGLDIALRRRFEFIEMPALPELLNGISVAGIDIERMLETINQRIEVLLDRDHQIGHAYFLPLKEDRTIAKLGAICRNQILPLLQEYFFEDWQRIRLVLNDPNKKAEHQFLKQADINIGGLFPGAADIPDRVLWDINEAAFSQAESYIGIYAPKSVGNEPESTSNAG